LEAQLLKLKEQREALKEDGAVHEDLIMKENAKLQKEVKSRVQYIIDVLGKMDIALEQPVLSPVVEKSRTRSPSPKETRRVRKASSDSENNGDRYKEKFQKAQNYKRDSQTQSRDRSEETTKRSKSKKKHKDSKEEEKAQEKFFRFQLIFRIF
jgi:hypothetical protein